MTPAARVAAAIGVLDRVLGGEAAEKALTNWARANRYAGSGDRAAVRDHVFDALRCRRSFAALGGAETGRGLMIGALRAEARDPAEVFTGEGYAPPPLTDGETGEVRDDLPEAVRLDVPDWLAPALRSGLGEAFAPVMEVLRHRAPVFVRANLLKTDRAGAAAALAADGIETAPHPLAETALEVVAGARKLRNAEAYRTGLVELQDAASQAVIEALGPVSGQRVLDYCAGGGGKSLALAALGARVSAHDADPGRMADLPARAERAGADIARVDRPAPGAWDLVLADAPCSGSGAWRRQPEAKWRLTAGRLKDLTGIQAEILDTAKTCVASGGRLAYATCSILDAENNDQVTAFLARNPGWRVETTRPFLPTKGGDGFFLATFARGP